MCIICFAAFHMLQITKQEGWAPFNRRNTAGTLVTEYICYLQALSPSDATR
jgi:hypothetical protein